MDLATRVDSLLDAVLQLKAELAENGALVSRGSPNYARLMLDSKLTVSGAIKPYHEAAPGLRLGFSSKTTPAFTLRPKGDGMEFALEKPLTGGWLSLECDWDRAAALAKKQVTLVLDASSSRPLDLPTVLRWAEAEGADLDTPGTALAVRAQPAKQVVRFGVDPEAVEERGCRVIIFLPSEPFSLVVRQLQIL